MTIDLSQTVRAISCFVAIPIGIIACNQPKPEVAPSRGEVFCTLDARYGILVQVRDRATGESVVRDAFIKAIDGFFVDSVRVPASFTRSDFIGLALERAGTYTVVVVRPGYARFEKRGIKVTHDACHIQPVEVVALLTKAQ